ncbi:hypothetical protein METBIDRAFT_32456 [Metschnikowia bicuspidata var. bicuspidata NRRL YB-4993]|uniref:Uncharacterized protein n=1 Tax=Metschnikowia bicuspidata var. bicuspidata NRRL YB-4993 TaxID=869754 RepID=A0A1A0H8W5_9ASCO|nr:hypothetical protein METBIDRAFT_32456 [Metschnikowia bicuspidata var. bicuspidata NRRL YB-4993]OBA20451.1 hypothetical protein METBIDRAFT_32456 [Metschnikowia bicuspidata var. bicuspidata NRRL YB-4993]
MHCVQFIDKWTKLYNAIFGVWTDLTSVSYQYSWAGPAVEKLSFTNSLALTPQINKLSGTLSIYRVLWGITICLFAMVIQLFSSLMP